MENIVRIEIEYLQRIKIVALNNPKGVDMPLTNEQN